MVQGWKWAEKVVEPGFFGRFFFLRGLPRELWGELAPLKIGDEIDEFQ